MPLETALHIASLVATNPAGADDLSTADDHIRLLKDVLIRDLPLTTAATALGISVLTAASTSAARTALGSTATGDAVFIATTSAAARTALGSGATGDALFLTATAAAARTALGSTATGDAVFIATTSAAARTALGSGATGDALFLTATPAAARTALGATGSVELEASGGAALVGHLPAGTGAAATTVQVELQRITGVMGRSLESYGAVGDGVTSDSAAWDLAVASGLPILLGNKRYRIGSKGISRTNIVIIGQQMPRPNATRSALEGGSVLLGTLVVDGHDVRCENFGVDCGTAYGNAYLSGTGDNAFVAQNVAKLGVMNENNHFRNIVGLLRLGAKADVQTAFHAVLLESLIAGTADNITGVNGWFGVVLKVKDFNAGRLLGIDNTVTSVQLKSDTYAPVNRVNIGSVIARNGSTPCEIGFLVDASTADLSEVNVGSVVVFNGAGGVAVGSSANAALSGVVVGDITMRNQTGYGFKSTGAAYAVVVDNLSIWLPGGDGFVTGANQFAVHPVDVTVNNLRVYPSATTVKAVDIGSNNTQAILTNVNAASADGKTLLTGSVINIQASTKIGQYLGTLTANGVAPALVNGWAAAFGQAKGLVVNGGVTQGFGRLSDASSTLDVFMTIPAGMRPTGLEFYTSMQAFISATGKFVPVTVLVTAAGNASISPNRAAYAPVGWYDLTSLRFPTEIPATGGI